MSDKLKPCKECKYFGQIWKNESGKFYVTCARCQKRTLVFTTKEQAIDAWNKRTKESQAGAVNI